jgi:response regulator RpfG family c-di-GMP phosphodiesterase
MTQTTSPLALIIDDEPDILELLDMTLQRMQVKTYSATTLAQAMELLTRYRFDLCLTDMRLPDGDGLAIVRHIQLNHPQTYRLRQSGYGYQCTQGRGFRLSHQARGSAALARTGQQRAASEPIPGTHPDQ